MEPLKGFFLWKGNYKIDPGQPVDNFAANRQTVMILG
jgi:hypothetical protein